MGKSFLKKDLFKKIRATKGTFHAKMGTFHAKSLSHWTIWEAPKV